MVRLVPIENDVIPMVLLSYVYSSFYKPSMQNNFAVTQGRNALIVIMNIPRSIS